MCKVEKYIVFVCTGNTCRSPMAEAILKDMLHKREINNVIVSSAGIFALEGDMVSAEALEVLKREGIDLSSHKARQVSKDILMKSDLILTMTKNHKEMLLNYFPDSKEKIYTLKEYAYGVEDDIIDPFGRGLSAYEEALEDIKRALGELIDKI